MREAPFKIALFSIFITVVRIALFVFVIDSGYGVTLGRVFAVAFAFTMAAGTYLSAFAVRFKNSKAAGVVGLIVFGAGDMLFNEAAVIYVTSSTTLIPPESNFLNLTGAELLYGMQILTLIFGAMPTIAAAVMGWMQASFYKVSELNKAGFFGKIAASIGRTIGNTFIQWAGMFGIKFAGSSEKKDPKVTETLKWDWRRVTEQEKELLRGKEPRKIREEYPGMDGKTSENWYFRANGRKYSEVKKLMARK